MRVVKGSIKSLLRVTGYTVTRLGEVDRAPTNQFPEMEAWEKEIVQAISPYTMTSVERQWAFISALKYVHAKGVAGDIVECGVWKGGNLILAGLVGKKLGCQRPIWGFDTYEGMSKPTEFDKANDADIAADVEFNDQQRDGYNAWCYSPLDEVHANLGKCGVDLSGYRFVKGKCEDTLSCAENIPDEIAVLRLDTDWYESTKMELEVLFPRLAQHGVLIIDDYGHWGGARKAVDEYFKNQPVLMNRIDYTGRLIIKT